MKEQKVRNLSRFEEIKKKKTRVKHKMFVVYNLKTIAFYNLKFSK